MNFTANDAAYFSGHTSGHTVDSVKIITGVILIFLICFGLVFNVVVIHAFRKHRRLQTPTNYFIVGMTANDLVMVLLGMPFVAASSFNGQWMFGHEVCMGYGFLTNLSGTTSISLLTVIAVDRYLVVTKSHVASRITVATTRFVITGCCGYGLFWATMPLMGWGGYILEISDISCGPDWQNLNENSHSYNIAILIFVFVVPVTIMTWCYIKIVLRVRINRIHVRQSSNNALYKREVNVTVAVFCAILTFIVAWSPYAILSMWTMAVGATRLSPLVAILPHILAKSSCAWNPLIYVARNQDFRKALVELITKPFNGNAREMQQSQTVINRPTPWHDSPAPKNGSCQIVQVTSVEESNV